MNERSDMNKRLYNPQLYLTQLDYKELNYLTFGSIYIVIHSFNLRFRSINHVETIPIDPSWLEMIKKTYVWLD